MHDVEETKHYSKGVVVYYEDGDGEYDFQMRNAGMSLSEIIALLECLKLSLSMTLLEGD